VVPVAVVTAVVALGALSYLVAVTSTGSAVPTHAVRADIRSAGTAAPGFGPPTYGPTVPQSPAPSPDAVSTTPATSSDPAPVPPPVSSVAPRPAVPPVPVPPPAASAPVTVSAFGDSVMLGARTALAARLPNINVDAVEGRQARAVFGDIDKRLTGGTLAPVVVIHVGNNGIISADDLRALLQQLSSRQRVVVLTDRVPRDWQGPNNSVLAKVVQGVKNAVLIDWYGASASHPEWFYEDGLHLRPPGAAAYAAMVSTAVLR